MIGSIICSTLPNWANRCSFDGAGDWIEESTRTAFLDEETLQEPLFW